MALAEPLSLLSFADRLKISDVAFTQAFQQQRSATGGGDTRYADRAPPLWMAEVTSGPVLNAEAEGIMALINSRAGGLKTVLLYNPKLRFPSSDLVGAVIGATVPKLGTITDRLHAAFTGFPAGYVMPLGSFFGIQWDTSRFYLGQFAEARTASGSGAIASVEIWPPLPASIAGALDVSIAKPPGKFRIVPGSAYPSINGPLHTTIKFSAEQTYSR